MKRRILLGILAMFSSAGIFAQVTTSSISGRVTDAEGQPLLGATVKAVHTPTGTVYANASQRNGNYNIAGMRVGGPYEIELSFIGYNVERITDVYLTLGQDAVFDFQMSESSLAMGEIVVTGTANPVFNTNRTGAQEIITRDMMNKLPSMDRSLDDFIKLTPMASGKNFAGTSYRFNNVTVDGASFNNSFGLSDALGASNIEPISLESIDQIQVMLTPYDVRNGGFTGGSINSVTKSGTNEFSGSAYVYIKSPDLQGYRQKDVINDIVEFKNKQYGVSIGGPIIKNKLFFFVNGEMDRIERPVNYTTNNSVVDAGVLSTLSSFLNEQFGYNPGKYNVSSTPTQADRITARVDWNVNSKNTLSFKYYYLKSYNTNNPSTSGAPRNGRGPNEWAIPYSSTFYRTNNNFNIFIVDLNTTINERMSNTLKVGYSRLRDFRDMDGGFFPMVDILDGTGDGNSYTTFGTEANSYNNQLNSDIFQIQDNFTWNLGKHQLVFGTQSDLRNFKNGFAQNYPGSWYFSSVEDFMFNSLAAKQYLEQNGNMNGFNIRNYNPSDFGINNTTAGGLAVTGLANAGTGGSRNYYLQKYSLKDGFPFAYVDVMSLGFYVQDKWTLSNKFNLTVGLRLDTPIFLTDLPENPAVAAETYRDGIQVDVSKYPKTTPLFSPRVGFNWKPLTDGSLQIRGGTGLFSGTPPYVWLSNQAGNNGILFGDLNVSNNVNTGVDGREGLGFTGDINQYKPTAGSATRSDIAVTEEKFKYPSLWKTDIAVDYNFLDGWIATVEVLYSKDVNAIYHDNIGLYDTGQYVNDGSGREDRTLYSGYYSSRPENQNAANNVVMLRNTSKGYSIFTTIQLQKNFTRGTLRGLYVNASYTFGKAKSVTDGTSSVATSAWKYRPAVNSNKQELGYASGSMDGRWLVSAYYTAVWSRNASTSFGLIYQRYRPYRYSYTYSGDANGDGESSNDLIYIPKTLDEVINNLVAGDFASQQEAWYALDDFIRQDPYLKKHRGEYAKRNGAAVSYANQLDLNITHDFNVYTKGGKKNTLQFSFNIANVLNLLNKDWGVQMKGFYGAYNSPQYQFLIVDQAPSASNGYTLKYKMDKKVTKTFTENYGSTRTWYLQFGIKYSFN